MFGRWGVVPAAERIAALVLCVCSRLAPTHDCNAEQVQRMAGLLGGRARQLELILHQHLPIFHTGGCAGNELHPPVLAPVLPSWGLSPLPDANDACFSSPCLTAEHCVFCRFMSEGSDYRDCGHPCETNTVHLRDDKGEQAFGGKGNGRCCIAAVRCWFMIEPLG